MSGQGQFDALVVAQEIMRARKLAGQLRVFVGGMSQAASDTPSTTDTFFGHDAIRWFWDEPPDGVYVITLTGSCVFGQSNSGQIDYRVRCEEADAQPDVFGLTLTTNRTLRAMMTYTFVDVVVASGTGMELAYVFQNKNAGTCSAVNPALQVIAVRLPDE